MQITLGYSDVETAIRNYVKTLGIGREVTELNIIQQRKAGEPIKVELTLDTSTAVTSPEPPTKPTPRAVTEEAPSEKEEVVVEEETAVAEEVSAQPVSEPKSLFGG